MEEEQLQKEAATRLAAYRDFLSTEQGELILEDLKNACHYNTTTMAETPYLTAFNEGRRSVVMQIIETAQLTPDQIKKVTGQVEVETQPDDDFGLDGDIA